MTNPIASSTQTASVAATSSATSPEMAKLKKTAQQFEAVFMRQLLSTMRSASPGDGLFDSDSSRQFRDMSDAKMADNMAGKGVLGIADLLVKQFGARLSPQAAATATGNTLPATAAPATDADKKVTP